MIIVVQVLMFFFPHTYVIATNVLAILVKRRVSPRHLTSRPQVCYYDGVGAMSERFKVPVLKTGVLKGTGGSNPSRSAFGDVVER